MTNLRGSYEEHAGIFVDHICHPRASGIGCALDSFDDRAFVCERQKWGRDERCMPG